MIGLGYEIPINRHFHITEQSRPFDVIEAGITMTEGKIAELPTGLVV